MSIKVQCQDCSFTRSPRDVRKAHEHATAHADAERGHTVEVVYKGEECADGTQVFKKHAGPDPIPVSDPEPFPGGKAPDAT